MICLELCDFYIKLSSCDCKNICHETCFKQYIEHVTDHKNFKYMRCLICKKIIDSESYIKTISDNPLMNSFYILYPSIYF